MSIIKSLRKLIRRNKNSRQEQLPHCDILNQWQDEEIKKSYSANINLIKKVFENCDDMVFREVILAGDQRLALFYIEGLTARDSISSGILQPLLLEVNKLNIQPDYTALKDRLITEGEVSEVTAFAPAIRAILSGDVVLLLEGASRGIVVSLRAWEARNVEEPMTESVIRGSREGFTETLRINTSLLRRRIISPNLKIESMVLGHYSNTELAICYIQDLVDPGILAEVKKRLERIDLEGILDSGYIEELIEDNPYSIFPSFISTERPDKVAGALLEGRISLIVNNSPFALILPVVFAMFFASPEDYYSRFMISSIKRFLRYISFFLSLASPAFYVAITTYHHDMIPTPLLISLSAQREGVPFPASLEALLMTIVFEILLEAGLRMPRPYGQAISIVGALIIGEGAVNAGLVSAAMVIVIAITAIASLTFPNPNIADGITKFRFVLLFLASIAGLYGIIMGLFFLLTYLNSLRSFGIPFLSPAAPYSKNLFKDTLIRMPWWQLNQRRSVNQPINSEGREQKTKPDPGRGGGADQG